MGQKSILIVDDDLSMCHNLAFCLKQEGFEVLVSHDGLNGLREMWERRPDLIILDLMLPAITGEEVCKAIREYDHPEVADVPVVMLTAKSGEVDRIVGKVIGANAYLTKPFEIDQVLVEIRKWV